MASSAGLESIDVRVDRTRLEPATRRRKAGCIADLVGQSLAAVSLKGDLAMRLLALDRERAVTEIVGMAETARATLREMWDVAGGPIGLSLPDEVARAVSLLRAAGITTDVEAADTEIGADVAAVLSWAVREGTTNALRHSAATWCRITLTTSGAEVRLEIVNDGAAADGEPGNGITGMTERAAAAGGSVSAFLIDRQQKVRVRTVRNASDGAADLRDMLPGERSTRRAPRAP